jgi:hypothetical protein
MNLNTSMESHTISMEQSSRPFNLIRESPPATVLQLEHTMLQQIQSPTILIGETASNQILMPSASLSPLKNETNFANQSSSLRSNVKPHVLLENPPKVRVLKVSKEDIAALCQVITEFQEQFDNF